MRTTITRFASIGLGLALLAGCANDISPTAPAPSDAPSATLLGGVLGGVGGVVDGVVNTVGGVVGLLTRDKPVHASSASITLSSRESGVLELRDAGLRIEIPRGAIPGSAPMTITATAVAGNAMAYTFTPHGVKFDKPLIARQSIPSSLLGFLSGALVPPPRVAYFASDDQLNVAHGTVLANELLPTVLELRNNRIRWEIDHFSGYVIASGRSSTAVDE